MEHENTESMAAVVGHLLLARNVAHMWHWKVKSFAMHSALGDLYDGLSDLTDDLMEMYMGRYGTDAHIDLTVNNVFSENDALEFIKQLDAYLTLAEHDIPQDGFLVNKFQELQGMVSQVKYKMENLV